MFSYIVRDCNSATEHISMDSGDLEINILKFINTVEPRLSGLFDYPDFFSGPVFFMNINKLWSQKLSEVKNV